MLTHALQEWAGVCEGLGDGRLLLTARKGGIHERGGGMFTPEHQRFALLPSFLHQAPERLHPFFAADLPRLVPPPAGMLRISLWAEVAQVWKAQELMSLQALGPELPWTPAELATRFQYRGQPFLYVLALRIYRLPQPVEIVDDPAYAGCRSWIPLREVLPIAGSIPVVHSGEFGIRLSRISRTIGSLRAVVPSYDPDSP